MRIIIVFAAIVVNIFFFKSRLCAQTNPVPDSSFEVWSGGSPMGWTNDPSLVFQSSDAHSGSSAAGGKVIVAGHGAPFLQTSIPIGYRPGMLEGYYKLTSVGNDEIMIFASATLGDSPCGEGIFVDSSSTSEYKHFSVPFFYSDGNIPDSASILIEIENPKTTLHLGTTFVVDDISLTGTAFDPFVSVNPASVPSKFGSVQNYPNPFSQLTTISFISESGYTEVSVVNLLGEEVVRVFSGELSPGEHSVIWNAGGNVPGMYECIVRQGERAQRIPISLIR